MAKAKIKPRVGKEIIKAGHAPIVRKVIPQEDKIPRRYLNQKQAAGYLGISVSTITKLTDIPHSNVSERVVRYDVNDLDAWMQKKKENAQ